MKRVKHWSSLITGELRHHFKQYLFISGIFIVGILAGTLSTSASELLSQTKSYLDTFLSSYPLQSVAKTEVFKLSLLNHLQLAFMLWVSGWYIWLLPLGFLQVFAKGFRLGFTTSCLIRLYHFRGLLLALFALLPQNLILIPTLVYFGIYQIKFLSNRRHFVANSSSLTIRKQLYGKNFIFFLFFLLFLFLSAFIEGYMIPSLLQPLCTLFL